MSSGNLGDILYHIVMDATYEEASLLQMNDDIQTLRIWDVAYRMIQSKQRMEESLSGRGKKERCHEMMQKLLASANGTASYAIGIEDLFEQLNDYKDTREFTANNHWIHMTLIAYKVDGERVKSSVESFFCIWNDHATIQENLNNLYMRDLAGVRMKIATQKYEPVGIIGKGDFSQPIKKIFSDCFGFILS